MSEVFIRQVRKWGGSIGVIIPKDVVKKLELKEGDYVKVVIEKVM